MSNIIEIEGNGETLRLLRTSINSVIKTEQAASLTDESGLTLVILLNKSNPGIKVSIGRIPEKKHGKRRNDPH